MAAGTSKNQAEKADRPATLKRAPRPAADEHLDPVDTAPQAAPATSSRVGKKRGPYNVKHGEKNAATYRLPPDVHELIDRAREEAAANGDRLTKDDAVTAAIRYYYGRKRRR